MSTPALILAAGRGSRMGTPKALMLSHSKPWWLTQLQRLEFAGIPSLWVLSPEVHEQIRGHPHAPGDVVRSDSARPMFSSIRAGLDALRGRVSSPQGIYILPIDVPAPRDRALWFALQHPTTPTSPTFQGKRGHPIYLPWIWVARTIIPLLADRAHADSLRLDDLLRPSLLEIPVTDPSVVCNLNTPDDLHRFLNSSAPDPRA